MNAVHSHTGTATLTYTPTEDCYVFFATSGWNTSITYSGITDILIQQTDQTTAVYGYGKCSKDVQVKISRPCGDTSSVRKPTVTAFFFK